MSVIAKMNVRKVTPYGAAQHVELGCVCENDLMAAYAASDEDKLFTRYSPWGEMHLHQPAGYSLSGELIDGFNTAPAFYVMVLFGAEADGRTCAGAYAICEAVVYSLTDFGHDSVRVEFRDQKAEASRTKGVDRLNWRMTVDNPRASGQFKAGERCLIALFPTASFDRDQAIAAAHAEPVTPD